MSKSHHSNQSCSVCAANQELLTACRALKNAWDAGEEAKEIDWEDLTMAVDLAEAALAKVGTSKIS